MLFEFGWEVVVNDVFFLKEDELGDDGGDDGDRGDVEGNVFRLVGEVEIESRGFMYVECLWKGDGGCESDVYFYLC